MTYIIAYLFSVAVASAIISFIWFSDVKSIEDARAVEQKEFNWMILYSLFWPLILIALLPMVIILLCYARSKKEKK